MSPWGVIGGEPLGENLSNKSASPLVPSPRVYGAYVSVGTVPYFKQYKFLKIAVLPKFPNLINK